MDMYGSSNALAQSNNYISSYNDSVGRTKDLNDTMTLQRQNATRSAESSTDMDVIKDSILTAKSVMGVGGDLKRYSAFSKNRNSIKIGNRLQSGIETSVKDATKERLNNLPVKGGNQPSLSLSGDSGQPLGHADNPRVQANPQPEEQPQQPQQSQKEDEERSAEPVEKQPEKKISSSSLDEVDPKGKSKLGSKIADSLEISEETAGKLGSMAGGAAGLSSAVMGIMSDQHGGWSRMNDAERVGNIGSIVGGGAESIGTILDMTGIGATIGVPLQLIGGISDLVGGLFSSGAEIKKDEAKKQAAAVQAKKQELAKPVERATALTSGVIPTIQTQAY